MLHTCCFSVLQAYLCTALFFFFNDTATTEIYTLSLHDALPISGPRGPPRPPARQRNDTHPAHKYAERERASVRASGQDRKSTRLNSSHGYISYAVFCLKKKKRTRGVTRQAFS